MTTLNDYTDQLCSIAEKHDDAANEEQITEMLEALPETGSYTVTGYAPEEFDDRVKAVFYFLTCMWLEWDMTTTEKVTEVTRIFINLKDAALKLGLPDPDLTSCFKDFDDTTREILEG